MKVFRKKLFYIVAFAFIFCMFGITVQKNEKIVYAEAGAKVHEIERTFDPDAHGKEVETGKCGDSVTYSLYEDGFLYISGNGKMKNYFFYGSPFYNMEIKQVYIQEGVKNIGERVFYECSELTSIEISTSVLSIENGAFSGCSGLTSIELSNDIVSIGDSVFSGCSGLVSIEFPIKLKRIESNTFHGCNGLTSIKIPNSVTSIENGAFSGCSGLTSIELPNGVVNIEEWTFSNCSNLSNIEIPISVTSIGDYAFYQCSKLSSIEIPASVISIGEQAFWNCSGLTSIEIPNGVISIGSSAFLYCYDLTIYTPSNSYAQIYAENSGISFVTIGSGVNEGEIENVFDPNAHGKIVETGECGDEGNNIKYTLYEDEILYIFGKGKMKNYYDNANSPFHNSNLIKEIYIQKGIINIGDSAFSGCSKLISIEIPKGITSIGRLAFSGCSKLDNIEIPKGVTSIGGSAFYGCSELSNIKILTGVTSIGESAFSECVRLSSIEIPRGVTTIEDSVFSGCSELSSIKIPTEVISIGNSAFSGCSGLSSIEIPTGVINIGSSAFSGCSGLGSIEIPTGVINIGSSAFSGCSGLSSVEISIGVRNIGNSAFYGCEKLKSIEIPNSIEHIGSGAFWGCSSLKKVDILASINCIESTVFYQCSTLVEIDIPETVTNIRNGAFGYCTSLTKINIPKKVMSIGDDAFCGCNISNIEIPSSVTEIGEAAFENCKKLTSIELPSGITTVADRTFRWCSELTTVKFPSSIILIGAEAFSGCKNLKILEFPSNLTKIERFAFYECSGLTSIELSINIKEIEEYAFSSCNNITSIKFPPNLKEIKNSTFYNCNSLENVNIPSNIEKIEQRVFAHCNKLQTITVSQENQFYKSQDGVVFDKDGKKIIIYPAGKKDSSYSIPDGITSIEAYAFAGDGALRKLIVPGSVKEIGENIFAEFFSLKEIIFKEGITSINKKAFNNGNSFRTTAIFIPKSVIYIDKECFYNWSIPIIYGYSGSYVENFAKENKIEYIAIDPKVDSKSLIDGYIGWWSSFSDYYNLSGDFDITFELINYGGTKNWNNPLFVFTNAVDRGTPDYQEYYVLRNDAYGWSDIGEHLTYDKNKVTYLYSWIWNDNINEYVTMMKNAKITMNIIRKGNNFTVKQDILGRDGKTYTYQVNFITKAAKDMHIFLTTEDALLFVQSYHVNSGNKGETGDELEETDSDFIIENGILVKYQGNASKVTIPSGVTEIGDSAFAGNIWLESISIPSSISSIGDYAFKGCSNLVDVSMSEGLLKIGAYAFHNCKTLPKITVPYSVVEIGEDAFGACINLTGIYVSDNSEVLSFIKTIKGLEKSKYLSEDGILYTSDFLTLVQYPAGKKKEIYAVPDTVTTLSSGCFDGCQFLLKVAVPDKVENIASNIFTSESKKCEIYCHRKAVIKEYADKNMLSVVIVDDEKEVEKEMQEAWEKEQIKVGDVDNNGKIDVNDALIVLKISASLITPTEEQNKAADVNGDGKINSGDALLVLKYAAGLITEFNNSSLYQVIN